MMVRIYGYKLYFSFFCVWSLSFLYPSKKEKHGQYFAKHAIIPWLIQLYAIIVMYVSVVCEFYLSQIWLMTDKN